MFNSSNYEIPNQPTFQPTNDKNISSSPIPSDNTLPPNPDDSTSVYNFCDQTYETINCGLSCQSGMDYECEIGTCFYTNLCNTLP